MFPYSRFYNHLTNRQRERVDKLNFYIKNLKNINESNMDEVDMYFTSQIPYDDVPLIHNFIINIDLPDDEQTLKFFEKLAYKLDLPEHLDDIYRSYKYRY